MHIRIAAVLASAVAMKVFSAGAALALACPPGSNIAQFVEGGGNLCLAAVTYGAQDAGPSPVLIVVLHGDATSGGPVDYHLPFTKALAKPGVVSVALLRPGYFDAANHQSQGTHHSRSDNYTPVNNVAVGGAVHSLKTFYKARSVIVVGHAGGAAVAGVLIGKQPGLINAAVLISCPCDIKRWRAERKRGPWTRSESPSTFAAKVPVATKVVAITGADDDNTFPVLAESYVETLTKRNVPARFQSVPKATHEFTPPLQAAATAAIAGLM